MFGIGPLELVVILVVALLVFGPKRVPELARTVGRGLAEFRRASNDLRQTLALDELKQDLQRNLTENQTIQRPESRPNAAEDGVDSSVKSVSESDKADKTNEADDSGDSIQSEEAMAPEKHPGELPLGNDHEHRDEGDESDADSNEQTHSNTPSDPELGNVPVSGSNPAGSRRG